MLFITFVVILVTLVGQGLTLPWLIRRVQLEDQAIPAERQELIIQQQLAQQALRFVQTHQGAGPAPQAYLRNLQARLQLDAEFFAQALHEAESEASLPEFQRFYLELLSHQRTVLNKLNRRQDFDEELIRKYVAVLDLEEYKLQQKQPTMSAE